MNAWVIALIVVLTVCAVVNAFALLVKLIQTITHKDIESAITAHFVRDTQIIDQSTYNDE
jgi:hypothetical protein